MKLGFIFTIFFWNNFHRVDNFLQSILMTQILLIKQIFKFCWIMTHTDEFQLQNSSTSYVIPKMCGVTLRLMSNFRRGRERVPPSTLQQFIKILSLGSHSLNLLCLGLCSKKLKGNVPRCSGIFYEIMEAVQKLKFGQHFFILI